MPFLYAFQGGPATHLCLGLLECRSYEKKPAFAGPPSSSPKNPFCVDSRISVYRYVLGSPQKSCIHPSLWLSELTSSDSGPCMNKRCQLFSGL
jgi:hypothetical protein